MSQINNSIPQFNTSLLHSQERSFNSCQAVNENEAGASSRINQPISIDVNNLIPYLTSNPSGFMRMLRDNPDSLTNIDVLTVNLIVNPSLFKMLPEELQHSLLENLPESSKKILDKMKKSERHINIGFIIFILAACAAISGILVENRFNSPEKHTPEGDIGEMVFSIAMLMVIPGSIGLMFVEMIISKVLHCQLLSDVVIRRG